MPIAELLSFYTLSFIIKTIWRDKYDTFLYIGLKELES